MVYEQRLSLLLSLLLLFTARILAQPDLVPFNAATESDVPKLIELLRDAAQPQRIAIIERLGQLRDERAIEPLLAQLPDTPAPVRIAAVTALGGIGARHSPSQTTDPRLVPALLPLLQDKDEAVCMQVLNTLQMIKDPAAVAPLSLIAENPASPLRKYALQTLTTFHDSRAIPVFARALWNADASLHGMAIYGLQQLPVQRAAFILVDRLQEVVTVEDVTAIEQQLATVPGTSQFALGGNDARQIARALLEQKTDIFASCATLPTSRRAPARAAGILLLGWKRDLRAVGPAVILLDDSDEMVRWAATRTLANIGDVRALNPLLRTLANDTPRIRAAAALALGAIEDRRAIPPLALKLDDADAEVRMAAAQALAALGDPRSLDFLCALCRDADPRQRARGVELLGMLQHPRILPVLEQALSDPYNVVRVKAIEALGNQHDPGAVDLLIHAMQTSQPGKPLGSARFPTDPFEALDMHGTPIDPRVTAVIVLGKRKDPQALEPLLGALKEIATVNDYWQVVPPALQGYSDPRALAALIADAKQGSWFSIEALCVRRPEGTKALQEMVLDPAHPMRSDLLNFVSQGLSKDAYAVLLDHPRMLDTLHRLLNDGDGELRISAIRLLEKANDVRSVAPLLVIAKIGREYEAEQAIGVLLSIRAAHPDNKTIDDALLPVLTELAHHKNPTVAIKAQAALAQCGHAEFLAPLLQIARTSADHDQRRAALWAAAHVDDPRVVEMFKAAFHDPDLQVRRDALFGAGGMSSPATFSLLRHDALTCLWDTDDDVRSYAQCYLADDPDSLTILCSRLLDADYAQIQSLLNEVCRMRSPKVVDLLIGILRDPQQKWPVQTSLTSPVPATCPRIEAARSLGAIGDTRAVEPLIAALEEGDLSCRQAAAEALGALKDKRAVPSLIPALDRFSGDAHASVLTALKTITGQDFGDDADKWRVWWGQQIHQ